MSELRVPVTPWNSTVLGHFVKPRSSMWKGLLFDDEQARPTNVSIWSNEDFHLRVPWKHPCETHFDSVFYRVRPINEWVRWAVRSGARWYWTSRPPASEEEEC